MHPALKMGKPPAGRTWPQLCSQTDWSAGEKDIQAGTPGSPMDLLEEKEARLPSWCKIAVPLCDSANSLLETAGILRQCGWESNPLCKNLLFGKMELWRFFPSHLKMPEVLQTIWAPVSHFLGNYFVFLNKQDVQFLDVGYEVLHGIKTVLCFYRNP